MTQHPSNEPNNTWYLDFCVSKHICKNRELFLDLKPKNYVFITAGREVIWSQEVGTVHLSLQSGKMTLLNVVYTPKYDSNLISLGQLQNQKYHTMTILTPWFSNKEWAKLGWRWGTKISLSFKPSLGIKQCLCKEKAALRTYLALIRRSGFGTAALVMLTI